MYNFSSSLFLGGKYISTSLFEEDKEDKSSHQLGNPGSVGPPKDSKPHKDRQKRDSGPKVSPNAFHGGLQLTLTPLDWDEVMRRVHIPAAHPLSQISLAISSCFPTPTQVSTGQRLIVPMYTHCIMGTQIRITLTCP